MSTNLSRRAFLGTAGLAAATTLVSGTLVAALTGCGLLDRAADSPDQTPREQPGPTLAEGPPPLRELRQRIRHASERGGMVLRHS